MTYYGEGNPRNSGIGGFEAGYYYRGPCGCGGYNIGMCGCRGNYFPVQHAVNMYKGSTLKVKFTFPFDITNVDVYIFEGSIPALEEEAVVSSVEGSNNQVEITWEANELADLKIGNSNWFRVGAHMEDDTEKTFSLVYINVQ